jgi:hypothetical protein
MGSENQDLIIFYRTSDKGRVKKKIYSSRYKYLDNLKLVFEDTPIVCIADNVSDESYETLSRYRFLQIHRTELGNSRSFSFALRLFKEQFSIFKSIYFLEDDYLHKPKSLSVLKEGLVIADYVTLYDHPDKYLTKINPKLNRIPAEKSRVWLSASSHWKSTNSTTMTFAGNRDVLLKDYSVFKLFTQGVSFGKYLYPRWFWDRGLPRDFMMWRALIVLKRRTLISSIPGFATHAELELLSPLW